MKRIFLSLTFAGIVACSQTGFAQATTPAGETNAPAVKTKDAAQPATPATPATSPPTAEAAPPPPDVAKASATPELGNLIPLIVMDDVPLTDAIRNLARQAGLNYILDPKIGFGQVGPDGKIMAQPSVSVRWESITAEQALASLLHNYALQLTEDPNGKIFQITTNNPAALPLLKSDIIQLKYAGPSNVVASVQSILLDKRSKVMPDNRTSQLVIVATEPEMVEVFKLVERLDTKTKQVLIEARLLETIMNPSTSKGIDWSGTLKAQNMTFGNGKVSGDSSSQNSSGNQTTRPGTPVTSTTTLPGGRSVTSTTTPASDFSSSAGSSVNSVLNSVFGNAGFAANTAQGISPSTFFLNADGVRAVLSFLNTYAETKVISSPRTVTLDNETASIEVGTLFPIVNVTAGTANTTGGSQITYSNLTVSLRVTPRISANNYVRLQVSPRVVRLGSKVTSVVGGVANSVDSFNTREILTSVLIPSGNTLVMGGLIEDNIQQSNIKVPLLGDIPVLGYLFRSDSKTRTKSNMTVFLTPTIVEDEDFQPTKSTFLKTTVPVSDTVEKGDWSAWDSGKPKEWSKPKPAYDGSLTQPGTTTETKSLGQ